MHWLVAPSSTFNLSSSGLNHELFANSIFAFSEVSSPTLGFRAFKPKISLDVKSNDISLSVNSALITGNLTWRD